MDEKYFAKKVEKKWQKIWAETEAFRSEIDDERPKFYALEMLPYPSGNLHMGHVRNYSAGDALAWFKRLQGYNVLHPIGWDSFGQPAEDAAIKRGVNPRDWTEKNIETMRGQLQRLGISYDWSREIAAHRPDYYKFDQWFFLKMFELGLAYKKVTKVNWCSNDQATLSNEQASGGLCWRCGNPVIKKEMEQWFLKTTAYADPLLTDMAELEDGWPLNVLKRQRDWIGRSEGAFVDFEVKAAGNKRFTCPLVEGFTNLSDSGRSRIRVFTTRIDTIYGVNALMLAAEHPVIQANIDNFDAAVAEKIEYIKAENARPKDHEAELEKDGIDTGLQAINPFSGETVPVWVANYVMMDYGTGALMSVPAHDERDFEFSKKFGLPIRQVISEPHLAHEHHTMHPLALERAMPDFGVLVHSDHWNGRTSEQALNEMAEYAEKHGFGERAITFRLRDWGISRQRFWGAPIPIVYCSTCGTVPVKYEDLPVLLPADIVITGTGESPLAKVPEFVNTKCPNCGGDARRETDTMDTFVDSSWYFFRYTDPRNDEIPFDPEVAAFWTPVDQYIGGDDHAVMHLIYTRFWTKVMKDLGLVDFSEPVKKLLTQGMVVGETFFDDSSGKRVYFPPDEVIVQRDAKGRITSALAKDGTSLKFAIERMSKSKGNGVDPDEMIEAYGADAARLFVLFAAPIENELVWNEAGIEGAVRFLQRVWRQVYRWHKPIRTLVNSDDLQFSAEARKLRRKTHQTIKRVADSLESLQFNTPVAALMELSNAIAEVRHEPSEPAADIVYAVREALTALTIMLAPFAPHIAEELYAEVSGSQAGLVAGGVRFPEYDAGLAKEDEIEIAVQVNGKLRSRVFVSPNTSEKELESLVLSDPKIKEHLIGHELTKFIVVPNRLVNIVAKSISGG
jgi:leucyl-tRNA synthetase